MIIHKSNIFKFSHKYSWIKPTVLLILNIFSTSASYGQDEIPLKIERLFFDVGYRFAMPSYIANTGKGISVDLGANILPKNFYHLKAGFFVGLTGRGNLWKYKYHSSFKEASFQSYDSSTLNDVQKRYAYELYFSLVNPDRVLLGDAQARIGFFIKADFSYSPTLKFYTGRTRMYLQGQAWKTKIPLDDEDRFSYLTPMPIGIELTLFDGFGTNGRQLSQVLSIGIFYEKFSFIESKINSIPFNYFLKPSFLDSYAYYRVLGLKIGYHVN